MSDGLLPKVIQNGKVMVSSDALGAFDEKSLRAGPVRLNLACGQRHEDGWINIDARPSPATELVANVATDLPRYFPESSVDEVTAVRVLERARDAIGFMVDLHCISKNGATSTCDRRLEGR